MNKFERIKEDNKDGLDAREALDRGAHRGREALSDEDLFRLKWLGLYEHNQGRLLHAAREDPQRDSHRRSGRALAWIAHEHGREIIDCTTRQCVQIHWITLGVMPEILARLEQVGLTTIGACGDVTRNIIGCTVADIAHDEIVDGYATAAALHEHLLGNRLYSNLPRKFKISIAGCTEDCARGLINDVALSGAIAADGACGFNLRVGGGLSAVPRMARWIDVLATPEEACEVVEQVSAIFRDAEENRRARGKARFKFLLDGVEPEAFRAELE